jgi:hypothetical protein
MSAKSGNAEQQKPLSNNRSSFNASPVVGFKKQCVCRIHNADLSDAPDGVSPSSEILSSIETYNRDPNDSHKRALLSMLNNALTANFIPENIEGIESLVIDTEDVQAQRVDIVDFHTDGTSFPIVTADAVFELNFTSDINDSQLREWESKHDDELAWCVNFYWKNDSEDECLFLNAGVDGAQLWIKE